MQRVAIFLLVLFSSPVVSCNLVTRPQALHINNTMVAINDSLYNKAKDFGAMINKAIGDKNYSPLGPSRIAFERFIDSGRQSIVSMKDVGGSEELRNCEITLLTIEKNMAETDFAPFEHLTAQSGMDEISALYTAVKKDSKEEMIQLEKFKKLQQEYAANNGFALAKGK